LNRAPEEIYLSEVIKVLDDDELEGHCESYTGVKDSCVHTGDCGIRPVIVGLHEIVQNALANITLAQLVGSEKKVDERFHRIQGLHSTINL
jgi:DNA-binding IscR family transcriptional regulator